MKTKAKSKSGLPPAALVTPFLVLAALLAVTTSKVSAAAFTENNTYDFSQTGNATWVNYCAPTVAGDLIYHFGNTYPSLVQGNSYGPGNQPGADDGATTIIGGTVAVNPSDPPGPPAGSFAQLMGTTRNGGTTLNGMDAGLVQYLANNSVVAWNTQELFAAALGGANFLTTLQNDLSAGYDVLLAVAWAGGITPGNNYTVANNYDAGISGESPIGHAFEMIGYDSNLGTIKVNDPANNAGGTHSWVAEGTNYGVAVTANDFQFNVGGATAIAYGAVVTQPVPEPPTFAMMALGLGALLVWRRKRFPG